MRQLLVEVRIHRIHSESGDRFEVAFAYGDATTGEVKLPMELAWDTAADASYFPRKSVYSGMHNALYYDHGSKQICDDISIRKDMQKMFYRVDCCGEDELHSIINAVHMGRSNLDLKGKVTVRWAGETTLVPAEYQQSGDKISLMYMA